jgi:hypothetical protein
MDTLQRKSSSNTNSSLSSSTSVSPIVQQKSHSRSSSSSSSNSSLQKKAKLNDEMNNNRSLNDLSQFVQLNKEEGSFVPPQPPPPPPPNQSDAKEETTVITKLTIDTKFVFNDFHSYRGFRIHRHRNFINKQKRSLEFLIHQQIHELPNYRRINDKNESGKYIILIDTESLIITFSCL